MTDRILLLVVGLLALTAFGALVFRSRIKRYHALTWSLVELFWYLISFVAVCIGLMEVDRIEQLNAFRAHEKGLLEDYQNKKNILYAQTFLLKSERKMSMEEEAGVAWFHRMRALFDEGLHTNRWEGFVHYSDCYIFKKAGCYADVRINSQEYDWPSNTKLNPEKLFLKEEIRWVVDSLTSLKERKYRLASSRPDENANYELRYFLVGLYLLGLSLKLLKIYADYRRINARS